MKVTIGYDSTTFRLFLAGCYPQQLPEVTNQNTIKDKEVQLSNISELKSKSMKILILYDNYTTGLDLKADHGFAALISVKDYNLLFDTGTDGKILLGNMEKLGVDPKGINEVIISHDHDDHYGGLADFLAKNNQAKVYVISAEIQTKNVIKNANVEIAEIDKPTNIAENVYTTGSLGTSG